MVEFITGSSFWAVFLTVAVFLFARFISIKTRLPVLNPILVSAAIIIAILCVFRLPNAEYQAGIQKISWLLTPCTVCLGIPLYTRFNQLRGNIKAIIAGLTAGTLVSLTLVVLMSAVFGLDRITVISILPKSVTTAIAISLAESSGGIPALATAAVCFSGIFGAVAGEWMCKLFHIRDDIAKGVAFGTASHVMGTSKATELSELCGAVSGLSLAVSGILTSVIFPVVLSIIM